MARKTPPRDPKTGRFRKRGGGSSRKRSTRRARKNPSTRARRTARAAPRNADGTFASKGGGGRRRTTYRRNPPLRTGRMVRDVADAAVGAVQLTVGKAVSRALPGLVKLPEQGPVGVAIRAGAAVVVGLVAETVTGGRLAERLLEGGLQGCVEDLAVGYNLPLIGPALARPAGMVVAGGTTGVYSRVGPPDALMAYVPPSRRFGAPGMAGYTGGGNWLDPYGEESYARA